MSIRDAIDGLMDPESPNSGDAEAALAEHGHEAMPTELFGTALGHFADTAPIETADALAPIVTRTGPVPFESTDLTTYSQPDGDTAYEMFAATEPAHLITEAAADAEPDVHDELADELAEGLSDEPPDLEDGADLFSDFGVDYGDAEADVGDDVTADTAAPDLGPEPHGFGEGMTAPGAATEGTGDAISFGEPSTIDGHDTDAPEPLEIDGLGLTDGLTVDDGLDDLDDLEGSDGVDLFSVSFDDAADTEHDVDPDDLDFIE